MTPIKKSYENEKYDQFKDEVQNNRKANEFRKATNEFLKSKQIVLTVSIDPCTKEIIYSGDKTIIERIEENNSNKTLLSDIENAIVELSNDKNRDFNYSELDRGTRKDYHADQSVAKLPRLKIDPNSTDWTAVIGRKVVECYMKDIKERENLGYNKNKDKAPKWYPKDVKRLYASTLDKDASKKVMHAILSEFKEIEEDYRMHGMRFDTPNQKKRIEQTHSDSNQKKRIEQTHSDSPSKRLNIMKTLSLDKTPETVKTNLTKRDEMPPNHDDLRRKLFFQNLGMAPNEGWNVWVCKKKFVENEELSRKL